MARTDFFKIGGGGRRAPKVIDYGKSLSPTIQKFKKEAERQKAITADLMTKTNAGIVEYEKLPETFRAKVTSYLSEGKRQYTEAAKIVSSGISSSDQRYIDAIETMEKVRNRFKNLSEQLELAARTSKLEFDDDGKASPYNTSEKIALAEMFKNKSIYDIMTIQENGNILINNGQNPIELNLYKTRNNKSNSLDQAFITLDNQIKQLPGKAPFNLEDTQSTIAAILNVGDDNVIGDYLFRQDGFLKFLQTRGEDPDKYIEDPRKIKDAVKLFVEWKSNSYKTLYDTSDVYRNTELDKAIERKKELTQDALIKSQTIKDLKKQVKDLSKQQNVGINTVNRILDDALKFELITQEEYDELYGKPLSAVEFNKIGEKINDYEAIQEAVEYFNNPDNVNDEGYKEAREKFIKNNPNIKLDPI